MEIQLFAAPLLGQLDQKPQLHLRHPQVEYFGRLSLRRRADFHGLVLHVSASTGKGFAVVEAPLRQRHPQIQTMGREILQVRSQVSTVKWEITFETTTILSTEKQHE